MLYIHDRQQRAQAWGSSLEAALQRAFFADQPTSDDVATARAALSDLHVNRLWLACDCASGHDEDTWPMIGPRDGRGGMHPFRFGHVGHAPGCPFAQRIRSVAETVETDDDETGPIDGDWVLPKLFPTGQVVDQRRDVMSRLLRTALTQLGIERLHIGSFEPSGRAPRLTETPFARLKHLGAQPVGEGRAFRDVGTTFLPALPRLIHDMHRAMPDGTGVAGLYIGVVEDASVDTPGHGTCCLSAKGVGGERRTQPVAGRIFLPHRDRGDAGPYWAIGLIEARLPGDWRLTDALLIHALDRRTLLPIPRPAARELAVLLLGQMQFWRTWLRLRLETEICAPLFPSPYPRTPTFELVTPEGHRFGVDLATTPSIPDGVVAVSPDRLADAGTRRMLTGAITRLRTGER